MSSIVPSMLHHGLRLATRDVHRALDHHPLMVALLAAKVSVTDYGNALTALHGVYASTEAALMGYLACHPGLFDYGVRRKLPALDADLLALGRTPLPLVAPGQAIDSIGALVGTLYTLEGATLGGEFIARRLQQTCPTPLPMAFYRIYGDQTVPRWDDFLTFAETSCQASDTVMAISTAVTLFGQLSAHMDAAYFLLIGSAGRKHVL